MKIWNGFGTEHSMNLAMVGHFKTEVDARHALYVIDRMKEAMAAEEKGGRFSLGNHNREFSGELLKVMDEVNMHSFGYNDLEQFLYEVDATVHGNQLVLATDEVEVLGYIKVLLHLDAKIEMYSKHVHPHGSDI
ncbi:hypothetical protein FE697_003705 [Mumia zhuanghuii]|uniref:DUF6375 family protein n=2 Tax=Mumia TaxID=1546255 RepID=A0ABW1QPG6_9ACTN|nr:MULTISPECIES: DUF6375 family protein [Mumia]KAA1425009.1 hypothetical protein FE697_003705 [Mumia zhuanghuii]